MLLAEENLCKEKVQECPTQGGPSDNGAAGRAAWEFNAIKLLPATDSTVSMQDDGGFLLN